MAIIKDWVKRNYRFKEVVFPLVEVSYHHLLPERWFFRVFVEFYDKNEDYTYHGYIELKSSSKFTFRKALIQARKKYWFLKLKI